MYVNRMWTSPEGDEVGVAEDGTEEGEQELPHVRVPLHVPPPDLGQQRLEEEETPCMLLQVTAGSNMKKNVQ